MIEVKTIAKKRQPGTAQGAVRAGSGFAGSVSAGSVSHAAEADPPTRPVTPWRQTMRWRPTTPSTPIWPTTSTRTAPSSTR